ncbi:hypothetical protein CHS0354_000573 [Potamilus streckersoni]|uniref:Uncharacterized protein n=1 Tax=Potamilus streckersoni TaxID=2493646 RepID=A0AAE0T6T0_9BIVA|nr:hypothetical protein CHS0354_000573 [Potamilus streckersoni]
MSIDKGVIVIDNEAMGSPNEAMGSPNVAMGSPNVAMGSPNVAMGSPNVVMGSPNVVMGSPNVVMGSPNVVMGSPNVVMGSPNVVMGSPNVVMGSFKDKACLVFTKRRYKEKFCFDFGVTCNYLEGGKMKKRKANLFFDRIKQAELAPLALKIVGDMTTNVAIFPKPEPALSVITDLANTFAAILAKPEYPGRTGDLKNARIDLEAKLKVLGQYVNNIAKGDEAILEKSGFPLSKVPHPHGDVPVATEAGVELDEDGHFDIWATPPEAYYYGVIFAATVSDNPDDDPTHWVFQYSPTPEVTFTNGIVGGKKYKFAVAFLGSSETLHWFHIGCHSYGKTIDEAMVNIREAVELCLEERPSVKKANHFIGVRDVEIVLP